jgi:hypothetical protein
MGVMRNGYNISVGRPEGKIPLGRHRRRREDNVRMNLRAIGWESVEWMHLAQYMDQWQAPCEHGNELTVSIKCGEFD